MNAAERRRKETEDAVRRAQEAVDEAEQVRSRAVMERDRLLCEAHGPRFGGGLSYTDMHRLTGLSRGRIIQIVQGKSRYSKRLLADKAVVRQ